MGKVIDLTGQVFGRLTVIERAESLSSGSREAFWLCQCACGKAKVINGYALRRGFSTSCGCYSRECNSDRSLHDYTGQKFGWLTVQSRADDAVSDSGIRSVRWHAVCDCGTQVVVRGGDLRKGDTKSCGCQQHKSGPAAIMWKGEQIGYRAAHERIRSKKGSASLYRCQDCGNRARDWSYTWNCRKERAGTERGFFLYWCGCEYGCYEPRCTSCHRNYDNAMRKARDTNTEPDVLF